MFKTLCIISSTLSFVFGYFLRLLVAGRSNMAKDAVKKHRSSDFLVSEILLFRWDSESCRN